jgi:Spy/CpxP family protein refolding chaperone
MQTREIKALSPEAIADLREGRGMGASLPAELNGVPGPLHVLELKEPLKVTPEQLTALQRITAEMKASAQHLGRQVIAAEGELDQTFKAGTADEQAIRAATARIAALNGELRAAHLVAHLKTRQLLSDEQVALYNQARGYTSSTTSGHKH